jgi:hypothetical protein
VISRCSHPPNILPDWSLAVGSWRLAADRVIGYTANGQPPTANSVLRVFVAFDRAVSADQSDQQAEAFEAEQMCGAASRFLADAKDEKALQKVQHESSVQPSILQPQGQSETVLTR